MKEGIVGGEAFGVDASMIVADAYRRRGVAKVEDLDPTSSRAVAEYLSVLDDAAFGAATPKEPTSISPIDPAARYTAAANSAAVYAYSDNYLVDLKHAVIMDVEATTVVRQAEVGAAKTMIDRTAERFDLKPSRLVGDAGYGSGEMVGWLVDERGIEPHVKLMDKSERTDGTFSRSDFVFDPERDLYECPGGKELRKYRRAFTKPRDGVRKDGRIGYRAIQRDCNVCALKPKCCPNMPSRKIERSIHEAARDKVRAIAKTEAYVVSCRQRKKVEMLFAHLKRILGLGKLRLRGPSGAKDQRRVPVGGHRPKSAETGEAHPLSEADLRHMRRGGPVLPPLTAAPDAHSPATTPGSSTESADSGRPRTARRRRQIDLIAALWFGKPSVSSYPFALAVRLA